ncbi:glycine cleavage system protein GcvH [Xanthobacter sp. V4C-4]|uniref:glycine cleavage system protein GcvH n=1 Tax=Xanthobacter cornucopiae TaxID=3119924 RepID=UPI003727E7FB
MTELRYSKDHEYVRVEGETALVGISHYAQGQLGDVVFVELPDLGKVVSQGQEVAVVESVKAASEVYAPVSGEVIAVNGELEGNPALVNAAPESDGWFLKLKIANPAELDGLMDEAAYAAFVASLG